MNTKHMPDRISTGAQTPEDVAGEPIPPRAERLEHWRDSLSDKMWLDCLTDCIVDRCYVPERPIKMAGLDELATALGLPDRSRREQVKRDALSRLRDALDRGDAAVGMMLREWLDAYLEEVFDKREGI